VHECAARYEPVGSRCPETQLERVRSIAGPIVNRPRVMVSATQGAALMDMEGLEGDDYDDLR
jgi:hypothetical protein